MEREKRRREIERAVLVSHPRPAIDAFEDDDFTRRDRLMRGGQTTAQDCLVRALRMLQRNFVGGSFPPDAGTYLEINSFTPWSQYGDSLMGAQHFGKILSIHVENDQDDKPGVITLGTLNGKTFVLRVPGYKEANGWDTFKRAFPKVAKLLTNKEYLKVTSSFTTTMKLFQHSELAADDEIVDATTLDDDVDEVLLGDENERLRTQYMIWKTIGYQSGPVWIEVWRHVKGRQQYPHPRHPDVILDWDGARRTGRLSPAQKVYVQQAVRAAAIQAARKTLRRCTEIQPADDTSILLRKNLSWPGRKSPEPQVTVHDVRRVVTLVGQEMKMDEKTRCSTGTPVERKREAAGAALEVGGTIKKSHVAITKNEGCTTTKRPGDSFHNNNKNVFENPLQLLQEYDAHVQHNKRQSINKARAEFRAHNGDKFKDDFLGKNCCSRCGDEKPHKDPMECVVAYYQKYKRLPRQCTLPCIYCSDSTHTTDACVFIHIKCKKCRRRGHMQQECHLRTPLEWMLVYLDCCHLGKLTRENVEGPLNGRFGFGDVTGINIPPAVWEYVSQKKESLKRARRRSEQGMGGAGHARESLVGWTLLVKELEKLDEEKRKLREEKESFYREQRAWKNRFGGRLDDRLDDDDDDDGLVM